MISVCIATYNGELYIEDQINSILVQLAPNDEIVVSDDGSSDKTLELLYKMQSKDNRIKIFNNNSRHFKDNFENALKNSKGEIIFLSDQDDVWLDGKYNSMLKILEEYDLVVHDSIVTDQNLNIKFPSFFKFHNSGKGILKNIIKSYYYGSCMAFKRDIYIKALPFPKTHEIGHDLWLGLVAELYGKVHFYNKPFIYYRRHNDSINSVDLSNGKRTIFEKIKGRVLMLYFILKLIIRRK